MDPITLIIIIALIALLIWLLPMPDLLQKLLFAIAVVCTILWVLGIVGYHIPMLRSSP